MLMQDKVAIVTGAGTGLGRSHALLFARHGARVVVNDPGRALDGRDGDGTAADRVVDEIVRAGGLAVASHASVATMDGAQAIVDLAMTRFGRVDALVNNAGILRDRSFVKASMSDIEAVLQVHLMGSFFCSKAAWPVMLAQGHGRIVMTTSIAGTSGNFGQSAYAAAKMGVLGLMNTLAIEGERADVRVNAVSPVAYTRMTEGVASMKTADGQVDEEAVRRRDAGLVSPAVVWLGSPACTVSGRIVTAAAGGFGRVHFFETAGVQFDPDRPVTVEMFGAAMDRIDDLATALPTTPGPRGMMAARLQGRIEPIHSGDNP